MRLRAIAVAPDGRASSVATADFELTADLSIRFRKPDAWSTAFVHYWDTEPDGLSTQWPGRRMEQDTDGWFRFELPGQTSANLVFSDAGKAQSGDLSQRTTDAWFVGDEHWDVDPARFDEFLFPGGLAKALVVSMDDGPVQDRRLVELLNRYGIRGTFHLCSGRLDHPGYVNADEVASLYADHEVSTHSVSHPYLTSLTRAEMVAEVENDRHALSHILANDVRGHAYPFGAYDNTVINALCELGICYARTATQTRDFRLPSNALAWNPSCHHTAAGELTEPFLNATQSALALLFIFGHSWELDAGEPNNSWDYMESLGRTLGGRRDIWYATAIEVADYLRAIHSVQSSLAEDSLHNPSGIDLWLRAGTSVARLPAGESVNDYVGVT